jgi:hypothetical protein
MITDEQAKAAQEVAKTAGTFAEVTKKVGGFVSKVIGPASNQIGGILEDWTRYYRFTNLLRIADKVETLHARRKIDGKTMPIPPRVAIPMLESAALEDDDTLQDVWAKLIANSTDPNFKSAFHPGYIEVVRQMSPDETMILNSFLKLKSYPVLFTNHVAAQYEQDGRTMMSYYLRTQGKKESYDGIFKSYASHCDKLALKSLDNSKVYFDNLIRLRIVDLGHNFSGEEKNARSILFAMKQRASSNENRSSIAIPARDEFLKMTDFGQSFVTACISENSPKIDV